MEPEEIAKIFADWASERGYEWQYNYQEETYRAKSDGLFRQSFPQVTKPVEYSLNGEEVFVISDLHIASGRNKVGVFSGNENFFGDEAFSRFIDHIQATKKTSAALLVINGDIFDFLRVTEYPGKVRKLSAIRKIRNFLKGVKPAKPVAPPPGAVDDEFSRWSTELRKIGISLDAGTLKQSISDREKEYGLSTDAYKAIYKLIKIKAGHPLFFSALAKWLGNGNKLVILKGNHDLELYWGEVRDYIRLMLAQSMADNAGPDDLKVILGEKVLPGIKFIDDSVLIDNDLYVEHGHRYDKFTMVLDSAFLKKNPSHINFPFGSFFNRYVINRVELYYPFIDKVRPAGNILPMLIRDNFPLALKVIFRQIPFAVRTLSTNRRYIWFMINRVFWFLLALLIPVILVLIFGWTTIVHFVFAPKDTSASAFSQFISKSAISLIMLVLSYFLTRVVGWFQLSEPDSLYKYARKRHQGTGYRIMTMGHTHNPGEYDLGNGARFYNTGTWIPVIETSTASVRDGYSYTFLHLERDSNNKLQPANGGLLQIWNDDAHRADPQVLIQRK